MIKNRQSFPYHLVEFSPWPLTTSISAMTLLMGFVLGFQRGTIVGIDGTKLTIIGVISILISVTLWWGDVSREGIIEGHHTKEVQKGLTIGYYLFILSEILIFASLFFAFFYNSLIPSVELGSIFLPKGIIGLDYKGVPLLNTAILFFSGLAITSSQNYIINGNRNKTIFYLLFTIVLAIIFCYFQYFEYKYAQFTLTDSVYGSTFYSITFLHFFHMVIGGLFLIVVLFKVFSNKLINSSLLFNFGSVYYHFVRLYLVLCVLNVIYICSSIK